MQTRNRFVVALLLLAGATGSATAVDTVPLADAIAPWLGLLRSGDPAVRKAASEALVGIVRKHPAAANDVVRHMAIEQNGDVAAEYERCLVPLAKESPATVSAFIRMMKDKSTDYRSRNFGVKVLSQVGPAVATTELLEAWTETYCPVPGAFMRVVRTLGKDSAQFLATGYRHPDANVRKWSTISLRVISRTEPIIQKLFNDLQAEGGLLLKLKDGVPADKIAAVTALTEMARTTPGTGALLIKFLDNVQDRDVLAEAQNRLIVLGRESHEVVAALVAGIRNEDSNRVLGLALKVLPKVGPALNCKEIIEALGDDYCPVPSIMRRIMIAAGPDAMPVLAIAVKHANPHIRDVAQHILKGMPKPAPVTNTTATP